MGVNIMLLGPLISVIETLKERIAVHGASLRENETRLAARAGAFSGWLRVRGVLAMDTSRTSFSTKGMGSKVRYNCQ